MGKGSQKPAQALQAGLSCPRPPAQRPRGPCGALRPPRPPPWQGTHGASTQRMGGKAEGRNSPLHFTPLSAGTGLLRIRGPAAAEKARDTGSPAPWCEGPANKTHLPPSWPEGSRAIARRNLQAHHGAWKPWWGHNTGHILLGRDKRIPRFSPPPGDRELGGA